MLSDLYKKKYYTFCEIKVWLNFDDHFEKLLLFENNLRNQMSHQKSHRTIELIIEFI